MTAVKLEGVRLSELARCPRMCALRAVGVDPQPVDPHWQRYLARGHLFEQYVAEQYIAEDGRDQIVRQLVIPWPLGEGHADIYRKRRRELVEVKSTVAPDGPILDSAIRQVRLQLHYYEPARRAGVYLVNPSSLAREDFIPVKLTADVRDELGDLVRQVERAVETNGDDLPDCRCSSPGECRRFGCPFTDDAWDGWEPEPVERLDGAKAVSLVLALEELKGDHRRWKAKMDERADEYRRVQDELSGLGVEPGRDYLVAGRKLRRTVTAASESFSLARARKTGEWTARDDERFAAFIRPRSGSERWTVTRDSDVPAGPEDWGEVPWTDADLEETAA